jgi:hypothetical protein
MCNQFETRHAKKISDLTEREVLAVAIASDRKLSASSELPPNPKFQMFSSSNQLHPLQARMTAARCCA